MSALPPSRRGFWRPSPGVGAPSLISRDFFLSLKVHRPGIAIVLLLDQSTAAERSPFSSSGQRLAIAADLLTAPVASCRLIIHKLGATQSLALWSATSEEKEKQRSHRIFLLPLLISASLSSSLSPPSLVSSRAYSIRVKFILQGILHSALVNSPSR